MSVIILSKAGKSISGETTFLVQCSGCGGKYLTTSRRHDIAKRESCVACRGLKQRKCLTR